MPKIHPNDWDFDNDSTPVPARSKKTSKPKAAAPMVQSLAEEAHESAGRQITYRPSRHEQAWIANSLGGFFDQKWIEDVLRMIKGGKEASVYQCLCGESLEEEYLAAKIYRPRRFRQMKNDSIYREGRTHLDGDGRQIVKGGLLHAIQKRTGFGQQLIQESWISHEFKTMQLLHAAGADVPTPFASGDNAILMGYVGGPDEPAHTLNEVRLPRREAHTLFERVLHNIDLMLGLKRVHGDLSAFNILYWEGEICLIDFPQAINPEDNQSAYGIFERDVTRICEYFARQGVRSNPRQLTREFWSRHGYRLLPQFHPKDLDDQDEHDRQFWEKYGQG